MLPHLQDPTSIALAAHVPQQFEVIRTSEIQSSKRSGWPSGEKDARLCRFHSARHSFKELWSKAIIEVVEF